MASEGGPSKGESPAEGIRRIALSHARKAKEALERAKRGDDVAASIHAARKNLKKLRAAVRLLRAELGEDVYRAENRRYREAGRLLARSRDAEAKTKTLDALRVHFSKELPSDLTGAWSAALERDREAIATSTPSGELDSGIANSIGSIEAGCTEISSWHLQNDPRDLVEAGLLHSYRRARRAMKRSRSDPVAENVHEWRKRTKDLRHQLRILRNAWTPLVPETADRVHRLTDLLGDHHDLAVLNKDLETRELPGGRSTAAELIVLRQNEILAEAFDLGAGIFKEKPKAFKKQFAPYRP